MEKAFSVFIYLFVFFSSLIAAHLAEAGKPIKENCKRIQQWIFMLIAILLPCMLAALRADSVGVDTKVIADFFRNANYYESLSDMNIGVDLKEHEFIYSLMVYTLSRFTDNPGVLFFSMQALTIIPIVISAYRLRNRVSITNVLALYLFCFFNNSLNIVRQSVACSFILLGTVLLLTKEDDHDHLLHNYFRVVLCYIFAILMHKSSFIGIFIFLFIYLILNLKITNKLRVLLYVLVMLLPVFLDVIVEGLKRIGLMSTTFQYYYDSILGNINVSNRIINPFTLYCTVDVLLRATLLSLPLLFLIKEKKDLLNNYLKMATLMGFLLFVTILYILKTNYGQRLSMFLDFGLILLLPVSANKPNIKIKTMAVYCLIIVYWFVWIIRFGWSGSEIYMFR